MNSYVYITLSSKRLHDQLSQKWNSFVSSAVACVSHLHHFILFTCLHSNLTFLDVRNIIHEKYASLIYCFQNIKNYVNHTIKHLIPGSRARGQNMSYADDGELM